MTNRPNPDHLLAQMQAEDDRAARGKLKIFLGYAAGVGKTFAMLLDAHDKARAGVDVVIGYVETHQRAETEALVEGLEMVDRAQIAYRGTTLPEMDLDAVLARKPELAVVDELAHTNAPGSRHPKRYQDVEELLAAGVDVYTTLNIQHLESLNDIVAQITGVIIRETIPDRIFDSADDIELIDLPTDELRQRLNEGKVYVPEQAERAIHKFFRQGNLVALRELALRRAAQRIDAQMRDYMQTRAISGPWAASERVLVCISPHPLAERLVRAGRRMAQQLNAPWIVLYVETTNHGRLPISTRDKIQKTLRLAEELGAEVVTLTGDSIATTILTYARQQNVTKIVAGKPVLPWWKEALRGGSLVNYLIRHSGAIDLYIISGDETGESVKPTIPAPPAKRDWRPYAESGVLITLVTILGQPIRDYLAPTNVVMFFLLVVVLSAVRHGRGPSVFAAVMGVLAFDFFFVPPHFTFAVSNLEYIFTFIALLIVGLVISNLAARQREQAQQAQRREHQTATLYALSKDLAAAADMEAIALAIQTHVKQLTGFEGLLLLPHHSNGGKVYPYGNEVSSAFTESEAGVASWAFTNGQPAGRGTDTLPSNNGIYYPLRGAHEKIGVLGVLLAEGESSDSEATRVMQSETERAQLSREQRRLLEAFVNQIALAIERLNLAGKAQQVQVLRETERLQNALLNSISHDLRTPLVSITGALSTLRDDGVVLDDGTEHALLDNAYDEANRLNRLVGNFLELSKMEAGALRPAEDPSDVQDLIGVALEQTSARLQGREVLTVIEPDLPLVPLDFVLMNQVLVNLLENAAKYSPEGSPIEVRAERNGRMVEITIADRGIGIAYDHREQIFEKFYRVDGTSDRSPGSGLGLAIAKGIVEAHHGTIEARPRMGGGTEMVVGLGIG